MMASSFKPRTILLNRDGVCSEPDTDELFQKKKNILSASLKQLLAIPAANDRNRDIHS